MKRLFKSWVARVGLGLLILAATVSSLAIGPGDHSKAPDDTVGHVASCTAQGVVIHDENNPFNGSAQWEALHDVYVEQCPDIDGTFH